MRYYDGHVWKFLLFSIEINTSSKILNEKKLCYNVYYLPEKHSGYSLPETANELKYPKNRPMVLSGKLHESISKSV